MAPRPYFGAIFGHFEPFLALFGPFFLTLFGLLGEGQRVFKVGVKWGGCQKLTSKRLKDNNTWAGKPETPPHRAAANNR